MANEQWGEQLANAATILESVQNVITGATVLDASAANDLKQQQLNLKLKAKVREQKLQQRVGELEAELAAARKASEGQAGSEAESPTAVSGLAKDFVIVHSEIQTLRREVGDMHQELQKLTKVQGEFLNLASLGQRSQRMDRVAILVATVVAFASVLLPMWSA